MSHYKKIQTNLKNGQSLVKALTELGLQPKTAQNLKSNTITMINYYGYANQPAAIIVERDQMVKQLGNAYGAMGFAWNEKTGIYDVIQDDLDAHNRGRAYSNLMNKINQRYALAEVKRNALIQGYSVKEIQNEDGSIQVVCTKY